MNQNIVAGNYYIPHVQHELERAAGFEYFIDLDLTNAFHQIALGKSTSEKLSVATPFGLKRPIYMPEGITPASGILQRTVMNIFSDFADWTIALFDNLLILCNGMDDGLVKLQKIIDRCYERNVVLKFSKSWIGFEEVKFFGYRVVSGRYKLEEDRKQAVLDSPMPKNAKGMQRFLEVGLFFNEFIPDYASTASKLYDMIKPTFNWNTSTWTEDYEA